MNIIANSTFPISVGDFVLQKITEDIVVNWIDITLYFINYFYLILVLPAVNSCKIKNQVIIMVVNQN